MTQLDIPQISFARYLELLKRRRWQVIPVTVLGLVIGTAVAQLLTIGGLGIWSFIDFLIILFGEFTDADGFKIRNW